MKQLKQEWKKLETRLEALSLRERGMVGAAAVASVVFFVYLLLIDPAMARERNLKAEVAMQKQQIALIDQELLQRQALARIDPDDGTRKRLAMLKNENEQMRGTLRDMQKGLVAPEKMAQLLEHMLKGNKLKLVSLKTLPAQGMSDGRFSEPEAGEGGPGAPHAAPALAMPAAAAAAPLPATAPGAAGQPAGQAPLPPLRQEELLYRHGVQVVLQGSYLDMVAYMESLERMPSQLFWGKAKLDAEDYPAARLTLTLYTLSLDTKWISL
jgi:MSHA biogenesis protein MshJ